MRVCRVGLAQINTLVGDIPGNLRRVEASVASARAAECALVALPELAITGYPPEDLVLRRDFCESSRAAVRQIVARTQGLVAIVGFVDWVDGSAFNGAAVLANGRWVDTYHKRRLPNYGVFDEERYFAPGRRMPIYRAGDVLFAVSICEDVWYPGAPLEPMALAGAELAVNINASPYHAGRLQDRARMLATRAADNLVALAYVNAVGGQDELVFDGGSLVFGAGGHLLAQAKQFDEELLVVDVDLDEVAQRRLHDPRRRVQLKEPREQLATETLDVGWSLPLRPTRHANGTIAPVMSTEEEVWRALVLGTRDYLAKTDFREVVIGLSGGIDSTVVAAIAVDAIGAANVVGVSMPSRYSSEHSQSDARAVAENLGMRYITIPIEPAHAAMLAMLADAFEGTNAGVAEENLQARQRGNVLMTLSNKFGWLVLTTGNKSEMATGYATLYGDMAGGYAVLKDVPKTLVYRIARWRNSVSDHQIIPPSVFDKPPSAELRPNQRDQDSLPPYEVLDPILAAYVEEDRTEQEIASMGFEPGLVHRVIELVDRNEYKRRQAPPGVKITPRAFGRDRRLPLAAKYRLI